MGNFWDIVKMTMQGVSEDITHKKAVKGVGKWNDIIKNRKDKKKPVSGTPPRMALSPRRSIDIKRKIAERQAAEKY